MRSSDLYGALLTQLRGGLAAQPDKPEEDPRTTLDTLWLLAQGQPCSVRMAPSRDLAPLIDQQVVQLHSLVQSRLSGVPLAHLAGRQHFMGLELLAGRDALVPRLETEILARTAIDIGSKLRASTAAPRFLDVCTGSGNIALLLAAEVATAIVGGCDLSDPAVDLARRNAAQLQLADRVEFRAGDLLAPFRDVAWIGQVDLITCNPPYISSAKVACMASEIADHEPSMAFDGGPFGVSILMRLLQEAPEMLRAGGWLAFEVGLGQGPAMERRLRASGRFRNIDSRHDDNGQIRAISAQCG
jgi:release factor glutamine methyltransferase